MPNNSWTTTLWQRISQWLKSKTSTSATSTPILPTPIEPDFNPTSPSEAVLPSTLPEGIEPTSRVPSLMPVTHTLNSQSLPTLRAELRIRQGDLLTSSYPLMVGHYQEDVISGAEQVLDQALKGQLSQWQSLGIYAGVVGTSTLVLNLNTKPQGALVLGLGIAGQLHANKLSTTYTQGLLRYTRDPKALKNKEGKWQLSALLIGAQASTVTLEQVLSSLLRGIRAASERLQDQQLPYQFAIEVIELDTWRALEASDILFELIKQVEYSTEFMLTEYLQQLPTATPLIKPQSQHQGWWSRWDVTTNLLPYTPSEGERALPTVALLPTTARAQWGKGSHVSLQVDASTLGIRWELLHDVTQGSTLPLGLQVAVVRQLAGVNPPEVISTSQRLLAIGVDSIAAWREVLNTDRGQDWLPVEDVERLFCALHTGEYGVLHWCGQVGGTAKQPHLVMAQEQVLDVMDIAQIRKAPSLVVLELLNVTPELSILVPSLISTWLQAGAQTVLVNTQTLNSQVSTVWLRSFYQAFCKGEGVGKAVFAARQQVWEAMARQGTEWVGFECYGEAR
jgi:hypothetical protein